MTETPGLEEQRKASRESDGFLDMQARVRSSIPLNRFGHPDDIARTILFCVSPLAPWSGGVPPPSSAEARAGATTRSTSEMATLHHSHCT
jgi:NAD(P)-dependent dehydrogenase (short-subunit alcohol dehydrogenase family)